MASSAGILRHILCRDHGTPVQLVTLSIASVYISVVVASESDADRSFLLLRVLISSIQVNATSIVLKAFLPKVGLSIHAVIPHGHCSQSSISCRPAHQAIPSVPLLHNSQHPNSTACKKTCSASPPRLLQFEATSHVQIRFEHIGQHEYSREGCAANQPCP